MKVITIHQPRATLIALGEKEFETRGWATKYRGELAIHAGKKVNRDACEQEPIKSTLAKYGYTADNLPTGSIVAIATLLECWLIERCLRGDIVLLKDGGCTRKGDPVTRKEAAFGYYDNGRYAWQMDDVAKLAEPIPAKGQQGLWNYNE